MFTDTFGLYVIDGDRISCHVDGFDVVAWTERDDCGDAPDERQDGFWPSLDPNDSGYIGAKSKATLARHMAKANKVMEAWKADEWNYCGVCVAVSKNGVQLTEEYCHALWGVERNYPGGDNSYLVQAANELLPEALNDAKSVLARLCEEGDARGVAS